MEALAAVSLVGTIVQFVDFSGKLISKSIRLYRDGALVENVDIETATNNLVVLNEKLKDNDILAGEGTLQSLSQSCHNAATDLLSALNKVKVKDRQQQWESFRKALRSVWSKDEIRGLEQRVAKLKEELNLHIIARLSEQLSQFKQEHLDKLEMLDSGTKRILDAIVEGQDVFQTAHKERITLTMTLHENTRRNINDTRQEIIREFRLPRSDIAQEERWSDALSNVTQAAFDSFESQHELMCLQNTRVNVLNEIRSWADGQDERRIFWLNGLAGTGKSTIARTIAREYFELGRLGASFFFAKGGGDVGHARKFFTTIAFQLAEKSPSLKSYILGAVSENKDINNKSLRDQWHQLILQPLSRLDGKSSRSSYILVVDALDECDGESDIQAILQLLAESRSLKTVQLRIFLTSRPEIPIRHGFFQISDAEHQHFVLHNISPSIIDNDIRVFLEYNFKFIAQKRSLDAGWPGQQVIKRLIQKASGLFIWAATACRFVGDGKKFAVRRRLNIILEGGPISPTSPEKYLNEIYVTVLKQSINPDFTDEEREEMYWLLRQILGNIVVLLSPLSTDSLCRLLHVTKEDIDQTLEDLHAILDIPEDQTRPLRLHHPSFRDFLINKERCEDPNFLIDEKQAHRALVDNSIRLMTSSLKPDICNLDTYGVFATEIDSSQVQQSIPPEVQYACLYWIDHLQRSGGQLYDGDQVHQFLLAHVLNWLEALSWMRKVSEGIRAITSLESVALASGCPGLYALIHDIKRFALYGRPVIDQAPLQVYCSALVFAPKMCMVRKQFETLIPRWIKILPEIERYWNAALQTLEGHSTRVKAVTFSPDGKVLASASGSFNAAFLASDKATVNLWDAGTGAALQTLNGHSTVAFSPDGKVLASASGYNTIKLWDVSTGAALQTLQGHSDLIKLVVFSPDGKILASISHERTVKLWDASTGATLQALKGHHSSMVNSVAFSPDGKVLALASYDRTVKLWDVGTEEALQTLEGHSGPVDAVAFSPDGKVLASASCDQVNLWDADTGVALRTFKGHSRSITAVAFSPDGDVVASASYDRVVKLWNAGTGAALQTLKGHSGPVDAIAFSPQGKVLASASVDRMVKLWDTGPGAALQTLVGHSSLVTAVTFSPDGMVVASASGDGTVKLWDADKGAVLQTLEGHLSCVNAVTFSPDGKVVASASKDRAIKLWDAGTGDALQTLVGHSLPVTAVTFSPDGKMVASASGDWTVKLWDTGAGVALQTLVGHLLPVAAVTFSPDGQMAASASRDRTIKLWDAGTGAALQTLEGHLGPVTAVTFSPDGKVVASASDDRTIKLWDVTMVVTQQTPKVDAAVRTTFSFTNERILLKTVIQSISFVDDGMLLETDNGILCFKSSSVNEAFSRQNLSYGIFIDKQWITRGMENLIWLPSEYRPSCTTVRGNVIALGHASGRVSIMEFAS